MATSRPATTLKAIGVRAETSNTLLKVIFSLSAVFLRGPETSQSRYRDSIDLAANPGSTTLKGGLFMVNEDLHGRGFLRRLCLACGLIGVTIFGGFSPSAAQTRERAGHSRRGQPLAAGSVYNDGGIRCSVLSALVYLLSVTAGDVQPSQDPIRSLRFTTSWC